MEEFKQVQLEDVTDIREVRGVRITVSELNKISFYQVPKAFHHNPHYIKMNSDSKLAYAILRDLLELSAKNGWVNENGEIYVKLSRQKLMLRLNIKGKQKMAKVMKELKDYGLIEEEFVGLNKCNKIYVLTPNQLNNLYDDSDLLELIEEETPVKASKINGGLKIKPQAVRKSNHKEFENQTYTKTNNTKTNNTKTNNISSSKEDDEEDNRVKDLLKLCQRESFKLKKTDIESLLVAYDVSKIAKAIVTASSTSTEIKNYKGYITKVLADMETVKPTTINVTKQTSEGKETVKKLRFNDFPQRDADYNDIEKRLLGWDEDEEENDDIDVEDVLNSYKQGKKMV